MASDSPDFDRLIADIEAVADAIDRDPRDITLREYVKFGKFDRDMLRRFGGLAAIKKARFGPPDRDLEIVRANQRVYNYIAKLERDLGDRNYAVREFSRLLHDIFKKRPLSRRPLPRFEPPRGPHVRANTAVVSDTHFGLDIDHGEVTTNEYNWKIACRRMGKFCHEVATFKQEHRDECHELIISLVGDICHGVIHPNNSSLANMTRQIHGAMHILTHFVDYLLQYYSLIRIVCTPDNHMRFPFKGPDRATEEKYDGFATMLHMQLHAWYRTEPRIRVIIPMSAWTDYQVFDHNFMATHGDTVIQTGSVTNAINVKAISAQLNERIAAGAHIDALIMGHVHTPLNMTLNTGVELVVNGTGSGTDPHATGVGYYASNPTQVLFESTPDYAIGDFRKIRLKDADINERYDAIIPTYEPPENFGD